MKSEGNINRKLKQVLFRHLKKHLSKKLAQVPENCLYNRQVRGEWFDDGARDEGTPNLGLVVLDAPRICIHAEKAGICCDKANNLTTAYKICPYFTPVKSRDVIKREFVKFAKKDRATIAEHMPDAAALMWVLEQESGIDENVVDDVGEAAQEAAPEVTPEGTPEVTPEGTPEVLMERRVADEYKRQARQTAAPLSEDSPWWVRLHKALPGRFWPWNWWGAA